MKPVIRIYGSPSKLAESFAGEFSEKVRQFSEKKSKVNIALSGGSTPKLFFNVLSEKYKNKINWQEVNLYWADERCVPPDNADSNYGMTKEFLLDNISILSENIHRIIGENNPGEEAERYANEIEKNVEFNNGFPEFNIILLGIGEDGHTASIFPDQIKLIDTEKICAVSVHPVTLQKRITLTGRIINNASYIAFLVSGESKSKVVSEIMNQSEESKKYPAAKISPSNGQLVWFLDKDAANLI